MLDGTQVLVVEDEVVLALDLAETIREAQGEVIGPADNVAEARELIRTNAVDVGLLDISLADGEVTPILEALRSRGVPTIIYTAGELPRAVRERHPSLTVLRKPALPARIIGEIWKARRVDKRALSVANA